MRMSLFQTVRTATHIWSTPPPLHQYLPLVTTVSPTPFQNHVWNLCPTTPWHQPPPRSDNHSCSLFSSFPPHEALAHQPLLSPRCRPSDPVLLPQLHLPINLCPPFELADHCVNTHFCTCYNCSEVFCIHPICWFIIKRTGIVLCGSFDSPCKLNCQTMLLEAAASTYLVWGLHSYLVCLGGPHNSLLFLLHFKVCFLIIKGMAVLENYSVAVCCDKSGIYSCRLVRLLIGMLLRGFWSMFKTKLRKCDSVWF